MKTVLCYGDSNTYGHIPGEGGRYPFDVRWTGRLQNLLGTEFRVIEEGCSSRTSVYDDPDDAWLNGLYYIKPCLKSHCPIDLIILMLGTNDMKEHFHSSAEESSLGCEKLIRIMQSYVEERQGYPPDILLVSPPLIKEQATETFDSFTRESIAQSRKFAECFHTVAERNGCFYLDAAKCAEVSDTDGLHLTADGHRNLAKELGRMIRKEIYPDFHREIPEIPLGRYRHFKGNEYEVIGLARHSETDEPMVVYRALYGEHGMWIRPASMWNETVVREGNVYQRFTFLDKKEQKN